MTYTPARTLYLSLVLILLLAACADSGSPQAVEEVKVADEAAAGPTSTTQPTQTPEPTATPEPTEEIEPTVDALAADESGEKPPAPPEFILGDLVTYQIESTGLAFDYPAGWVVTENPSGSISVESEVGYGDRIDTDSGAVAVIIPMAAGDLLGQNSLEKLAAYIINHAPSASTRLGDPTTMILNGQELTFSAFVDQASGLEGIYAAILAGDELAVVFAIASGDSRTSYRPAVEAIVNSLILPQAE